jgi:hypothetical protein
MSWPLSQDYNEAVQNPASAFADPELRQSEAVVNALGLPLPRSGNFADVYEMRSTASTRKWAVKCFTREVRGLRERYREISAYLRQVNLPFMVDFHYLDQGVRIRGQWFPALKMDWVEGFTLNEFVKTRLHKPHTLEVLARIWVRLARRLREANLTHCDLQHGNVLLVPGSKANSLGVKLIDYDGMLVPALARTPSGEVGHPAYQHPQRLRDGTYNLEVDRFPHLVIYTGLRAVIAGGRELWERFDNGDNLLFRQQDLEEPYKSPLFQALVKVQDPLVRTLADQLSRSVRKPLEQTPLLEELAPSEPAPPADQQAAPWPGEEPESEEADLAFAPASADSGSSFRGRRRRKRGSNAWMWFAAPGLVGAAVLGTVLWNKLHNPSPDAGTRREIGSIRPTRRDTPQGGNGNAGIGDGGNGNAGNGNGGNQQPHGVVPLPRKVVLERTAWAGGVPGRGGAHIFHDARFDDHVVSFDLYFTKDAQGGLADIIGVAPVYSKSRNVLQLPRGRVSRTRMRIPTTGDSVVTGLVVQADDKLHGVKLITSPVRDNKVVTTITQVSQLYGSARGQETRLGGNGRPVLGIYGTTGSGLERLGLLQRELKYAAPDAAAVAAAEARLRPWLKDELDLNTQAEYAAYAAELLRRVQQYARDPAAQFVIVQRAHRCAGRAGDYAFAIRIAEQTAERFDISVLPQVAWALGVACKDICGESPQSFSRPGKLRGLLKVAAQWCERAIVWHDWPSAEDLTRTVNTAARELKDQEMLTYATRRHDEVVAWMLGKFPSPSADKMTMPKPPGSEQGAQTDVPSPPRRIAPPDRAKHKELLASIKKLHSEQYAPTKRTAERRNLAEALRADAATTKKDAARRFVVLDEARLAATRIPDAAMALEIADEIARDYDVNAAAVKVATLEAVRRHSDTPVTAGRVVAPGLALLTDLEADEEYAAAERVLRAVQVAAEVAGSPSRTKAVRDAARRLRALKTAYDGLAGQRATLARDPKDPAANLAVGGFYCFEKGDWTRGRPMLVLGNDPGLKKLAEQDLEEPAGPQEQVKLGDAWLKAADKVSGPTLKGCQRRAYHWYMEALPLLDGDSARAVEKHLQTLRGKLPDLRQAWDNLDTAQAKVMAGFLRLEPHRAVSTRQSYAGPISITAVARTQRTNVRILVPQHGGMVLFNWELRPGEMRIHRPDGDGGRLGSLAQPRQQPLEPNVWYRIDWVITEAGMKVELNGQVVFQEPHAYDLLRPGPVKVEAFDSVVDVKSLVVKPLRSRK